MTNFSVPLFSSLLGSAYFYTYIYIYVTPHNCTLVLKWNIEISRSRRETAKIPVIARESWAKMQNRSPEYIYVMYIIWRSNTPLWLSGWPCSFLFCFPYSDGFCGVHWTVQERELPGGCIIAAVGTYIYIERSIITDINHSCAAASCCCSCSPNDFDSAKSASFPPLSLLVVQRMYAVECETRRNKTKN